MSFPSTEVALLSPENAAVVIQTRLYVHFCETATTFWLLYDWVISLGDEIELIWTSANTPPKFLYFISRYIGLIVQFVYVTDSMPLYCRSQLIFRAVTYWVLHVSVELTLLIRIYALWNQSKKVAAMLAIAFGLEQTVNMVMLAIAEKQMIGSLVPYPSNWPIDGCFVLTNPAFFRACWIPILCFETLLFVLNTYKCLSYRPFANTHLVIRLFRDGTIYYALMFIILLLRTFSQYQPDLVSGYVTDTFTTAIFSYSGSALMLSIRSLAVERQRVSLVVPDLSDTAFPQALDAPDSCNSHSHPPSSHYPYSPHPPHFSHTPTGNSPKTNTLLGNGRDPITADRNLPPSHLQATHGEGSQSSSSSSHRDTQEKLGHNYDMEHVAPETVTSPRDKPRNSGVTTNTSPMDVESNTFVRPKRKNGSWLDDWNIHPS